MLATTIHNGVRSWRHFTPSIARTAFFPIARLHQFSSTTGFSAFSTSAIIRENSTIETKDSKQQSHRHLKILFFGSDSFSISHLKALVEDKNSLGSIIERIDVVAPKERPKKSKRDAPDSPLTVYAKEQALDIYPSPDRKGGFESWTFPDTEAIVGQYDFGVVVSFGWFLPNNVIQRFKVAGINVHPSLLPKYRGSAPLQRTILNQDKVGGVTVQLLDPNEFDAGKVLAQAEVDVPENSTYRSLEELLGNKGGQLLVDVVNHFAERKRDAKQQDPDKVTKANKISREACQVQWHKWNAARAERLERANGFRYPLTAKWPISESDHQTVSLFDVFLASSQQPSMDTLVDQGYDAQTTVPIKTKDEHTKTEESTFEPGTMLYHRSSETFHVVCADQSLLGVKSLQLEAKKRISAKDFFNGYKVQSGRSKLL